MNYVKLFLAEGLMGFVLQSIGYFLCLYTFNKRKIELQGFLLGTVTFSAAMIAVRLLPIYFGFHTLLILIAFILISIGLLKMQIYSSVLASLVTTITTMVVEAAYFLTLQLIMGKNVTKFDIKLWDAIIQGGSTLEKYINKSVSGIPTNILLVTVMLILYILFTKKVRRDKENGKVR